MLAGPRVSAFVFFNKLTLLQLSHGGGVSAAVTPPSASVESWSVAGGPTLRRDRHIRTVEGIFAPLKEITERRPENIHNPGSGKFHFNYFTSLNWLGIHVI